MNCQFLILNHEIPIAKRPSVIALSIQVPPDWLQVIAKLLPLVHIFEEMRNVLIHDIVNYLQILKAVIISFIYFVFGIIVFYLSYEGAKNRGTLINMGE